jgi:hypothetical protein
LDRFPGAAKIDANRLSRDADQIASAVVQHLGKLVGATVTVTIEIEAEIPLARRTTWSGRSRKTAGL